MRFVGLEIKSALAGDFLRCTSEVFFNCFLSASLGVLRGAILCFLSLLFSFLMNAVCFYLDKGCLICRERL